LHVVAVADGWCVRAICAILDVLAGFRVIARAPVMAAGFLFFGRDLFGGVI
jgi:hypothetical protein